MPARHADRVPDGEAGSDPKPVDAMRPAASPAAARLELD